MGKLIDRSQTASGSGEPRPGPQPVDGMGTGGAHPAAGARGPRRPGRIIIVAGEDHRLNDLVVAAAKRRYALGQGLVFPIKVATRQVHADTDVLPVSRQTFASLAAEGCFLANWSSDGRAFGLPAACKDALESGRDIIAAVPRHVADELTARGFPVLIVEIAGVAARRHRRAAAPAGAVTGSSAGLQRRVVHDGSLATAVRGLIAALDALSSEGRPAVADTTGVVAGAPPDASLRTPKAPPRTGRGTRRRNIQSRAAVTSVV
ncbi:MAG: hypothetical protein NW217_11290 [Hyphomicrobiaceae bacterium]|nr:hypothetical protein [Hyphomicrobiaceae bacterium]